MKKFIILILTFGALLIGTPSLVVSGPQPVNKRYVVVLKANGDQRSFQVCARTKKLAAAGAKRAWGKHNAAVVSITHTGPCSN